MHGHKRSLTRKCPDYSAASIKTCEFRTIDCFDAPPNQRIGSG